MEQEGRSYSGERFRALAVHLAARSLDDPAFDKDSLANLLYHCDFTAYARLGDSITGATYKNLPRGPYPECLDKELSHIEEMGEGIVVTADHPEAGVKRLVARNSPATATFAEPEVSIIEQVLEGLRKREASAATSPRTSSPFASMSMRGRPSPTPWSSCPLNPLVRKRSASRRKSPNG